MRITEPKDGWGTNENGIVIPRRWQIEVLPKIISHYSAERPSRSVIHAVTGSGKSVLIAQVCACVEPQGSDVIVVSTSRQKLVRQIRETVRDRLESFEFMAPEIVGSYFTDAKDVDHRIIVCCNDSMENLAEALQKIGRQCCLWICDELHRSESPSMRRAYEKLMPVGALGLSATPYRANPKEGISNFDDVLFRYTIADALADKTVVVPWIVKNWEGDETDLDSACIEMMKESGDRSIVNALTIDDAVLFAKQSNDSGYTMKVVHSKLGNNEIEAIIEELRTGAIQSICHIDLLAEGVDLPWVKSLTLRRPVSSRNRFVQELGRGIRYFKDKVTGVEKTHLIVNDPTELVSRFKLTYEAVLSGDFDPDDVEEKSEGKRLEKQLQVECLDVMRHLTRVKAGKETYSSTPLASYLSQLCSVFDTFGLMDKPINRIDWRREPASKKQVETIENLKWSLGRRQVPSVHRTALEILTGHGTQMTKGMASDLISIQMSLAEKSTWPNFSQLDQCVKDGLDRHEKRKLRPPAARKSVAVLATPNGPKLEQGLLFEGMLRK